jgi:hypothetical protein
MFWFPCYSFPSDISIPSFKGARPEQLHGRIPVNSCFLPLFLFLFHSRSLSGEAGASTLPDPPLFPAPFFVLEGPIPPQCPILDVFLNPTDSAIFFAISRSRERRAVA